MVQSDCTMEHGDLRLDVASAPALAWADEATSSTLDQMKAMPYYSTLLADARNVLTQKSRLGDLMVRGDWVYDYAQSHDNPLGIWQRSPLDDFTKGRPRWTILLDLDKLSAREGRKLFFGGSSCRGDHCLVSLSENGRDAQETREFDLTTRRFMADGFHIPASKSRVWWYDQDTLLVAPAVDAADRNIHGMATRVKLWRRGTALSAAPQIFALDPQDDSLSVMLVKAGGQDGFVAVRHPDFMKRDYIQVRLDGTQRQLPLPEDADILGGDDRQLLIRLNTPWKAAGTEFASGVIVGVPFGPLLQDARLDGVTLIYTPEDGEAVLSATADKDSLILTSLKNYVSHLIEVKQSATGWTSHSLGSPAPFAEILSRAGRTLMLRTEGVVQPDAIITMNIDSGATHNVVQRSPAFATADLVTTLRHTTSRDGTPIDYLVVHKRGLINNDKNPTLVYGYGGFDVPVTQRYEPLFGKLWVERGGVYVHAYLRGGGEHGPAWHRAALRENHPLAFEDMEAVLHDLQARHITSPAHTGIIGRSNGGLMAATVMERSPQLMNAAIIGGPLIDMLNYHQLPPGGTWMSEYGNPDVPADRAFLARYSPMQNIASANTPYPVPLIITSRDDDRVAPGHARRFSALLTKKGHKNYYFEDRQGGHYWELSGGPAAGDWRLRSIARAVEFTYLWSRLGNNASNQ